jgi:hypothetical protein
MKPYLMETGIGPLMIHSLDTTVARHPLIVGTGHALNVSGVVPCEKSFPRW